MIDNHFLPTYSEPLYRPPSESGSLIFQITEGCSHNKCTFCGMYVTKKFRLKKPEEIEQEIDSIPDSYAAKVRRIFLADGDAVIYPTNRLLSILDLMNRKFPALDRISSYVGSQELVQKDVDEWRQLAEKKLSLLYFGMESGNDHVLELMNKGHKVEEFKPTIIEIAKFINLSVMIILGGGGKKYSEPHALETASLITQINPRYASLVTLFIRRNKDYFLNIETPTIGDLFSEAQMIIANIGGKDILFRSNHVSNFISLFGTLPRDRERLLKQLDDAINDLKSKGLYNEYPEFYRENC